MSIPDAIDVSRAKSYLGIPVGLTQHDVFLGYLISAATEEVCARLGLTAGLTVNTYTEIIDVEDSDERALRLSAYPIVSVVALTDNGAALQPDAYYVHRSKRWVNLGDAEGCFTRGRRKVQITYTAGWATPVPDRLLHAVSATVAHHFNRAPKSGVESERIGAYSISLAKGEAAALPPEVEAMLAMDYSPVVQR